jgi:DNA-binding SARP family transcriptional activator
MYHSQWSGTKMDKVLNQQTEIDIITSAERLAQATAEYQRIVTSISALGEELTALGLALQRSNSPTHPASLAKSSGSPAVENPSLQAHLLGQFVLYADGQDISSEMPHQVQTVLKYLVSQRRQPVSKDALLDLLWPDTELSVACSRLRMVMHTLRKGTRTSPLGCHELVIVQSNNFAINPDLCLWVDVEDFERHWQNGWRLARAGKMEEAVTAYEKAESLYTGAFMADDLYADWTLLRREALRDAYSTILTMLASMSTQLGDHTGAIIWSLKLLSQDDCREDAYRFLILSHIRLGQRARAAHWYALCAQTLKRELGLEPSLETRALLTE